MAELTEREAAEPAIRQPPRKRTRRAMLGIGDPAAVGIGDPAAELGIGDGDPAAELGFGDGDPATEAELGSSSRVVEFDPFSHGPDVWTEVAKHLCPRLRNLSATCRRLHRLVHNDNIWRHAFFRDLNLPDTDPDTNAEGPPHRSWRLRYLATFNNSHAYWLRPSDKHIQGYRIGGLLLDSPDLVLTANLPQQDSIDETAALVLSNARRGVWIADTHLLKCPLCDVCDGRVLVMDARHCDLFFEKPYRDCSWEHKDIGHVEQQVAIASCAMFNAKRLSSSSITSIRNMESWTRVSEDLELWSYSSTYAAAISSNLQKTTGLMSTFMRDSAGQIVSVRISQQVLK